MRALDPVLSYEITQQPCLWLTDWLNVVVLFFDPCINKDEKAYLEEKKNSFKLNIWKRELLNPRAWRSMSRICYEEE